MDYALYRIEVNMDTPSVKLCTFEGSLLIYVDVIDMLKIHVPDKHNLCDDMGLVQLKMHVIREAISGIGSERLMYATANKMSKEQFGYQSRYQ